MALNLEIRGLGLDEDFAGQRAYTLTLGCPHQLEAPDRIDLHDLVRAWYFIGAHCGFGGSLNQLQDVEYSKVGDGETVTFGVVGALTRHALDDLLRCLTNSDIDVIVESVVVTISEHD